MLQIAICDDIPAHSAHLLSLLEGEANAPYEAAVFVSPAELLSALEARQRGFDLFFLDIELGEESGVALAKRINLLSPAAQIIFVTSNIQHAVQIDEANHTYFLVKPVDRDKLRQAFRRATGLLRAQTDRRLVLPLRGGGDAILSSGKILYCERVMRQTSIFCTDGVFVTPLGLDALEEQLPQLLFARPHNSYLVNLMHVVKTDWLTVYLDDGTSLSISNQRRAGFRDALATYAVQ